MEQSDAIKMYHNPMKGFWGKSKMMKKYREMLNKVYALQRHREVNSKMLKKQYKREGAVRPFFSVQIDLADFPKLQNPLNKNYRYFMICIDVFSRYMWLKPLRTKKNLHVPLEELLREMYAEFGKTPANMTGDNEFDTRELKALGDKYKFRWWYGDPYEKFRTGIVERSIRTIRGLIKRYLTQNDTTKYIDILHELVENYNDTEHGHIHTRPRVAIKTGQSFPRPDNRAKIDPLRVGDKVRVLMKRERKFDKGDKPYYSKELYEIIKKDGNKYHIKNIETGETSNKTYYIHQLLKVKEVIKNHKKDERNVGYDEGIEYKTKQRRNRRVLNVAGIDNDRIIDPEDRKELERDLNYDEEKYFDYHDKPLPKNMSDKKLDKKAEELEEKIEDLEDKIEKTNSRVRKRKMMKKLAELKKLRGIKEKNNQYKKRNQVPESDSIKPINQGRIRRERKQPKRFGYDY